ncbi:MAG TPA: acetyl-CoA carboxylase biotin carboxyl carrier protein [Ramlibacter sp.]|uniref:acetyl-CoA carboxylase biotin carboxyl carrier protein n=1 Tax=Ramlibacter sp. TaxID=1917967 RepID=UPI002B76F9CA|nr:acetyl-CoA carboxylase biotin carboxyl carrier protein [Ramlibacter sp.]HVZ45955.1 acetyl-CoA carboxylase biotin carboxyl carrier protein [Ramlibacter sp.]
MSLTFKEVDRILRIIEEFPASEVRFEYGDLKVHVRRAGSDGPRAQPAALAPQATPVQPAPTSEKPSAHAGANAAAASPAKPETAAAPEPPAVREGLVAVSSPMMGVFYAAPSPGAEPFVKAGQKVSKGDDLCIVEVMKIMNTIKAPCAGVVAEIAVQNAQSVGRGSALMWIRPEGGA